MKHTTFVGIALLMAVTAQAQVVETVVRGRSGYNVPEQSDLAIRTTIPHLTVEAGSVRTLGVHDVWLYGTSDITLNRLTLGAEAFIAPSSDYLSRKSVGGTVGYTLTPRLTSTNRYVYYKNPDNSVQHLYTTGVDFSLPVITLGGSVGGLTGRGTVGQVRISRRSDRDDMLIYASNWMEVPNMPWSTWVVREMGLSERFKFTKVWGVNIAYGVGEVDRTQYVTGTIGARYTFK